MQLLRHFIKEIRFFNRAKVVLEVDLHLFRHLGHELVRNVHLMAASLETHLVLVLIIENDAGFLQLVLQLRRILDWRVDRYINTRDGKRERSHNYIIDDDTG